jgi:nanoRNase/pAp phosphatase (c-di-AMP/oligoRNAs hydrolase)
MAWRRHVRRRLTRLLEVLKTGRRLLVLAHDNPDPDSIASALALQRIAIERAGIEAFLAHGGVVGRGENRQMLETLKIPVLPCKGLDFQQYDLFALVDTQPMTGNNSLPPELVPDIVIDHHPIRPPTRAVRFHDVRRLYGATTTIMSEYLFGSQVPIDKQLATALFYGIKSETQSLGREASLADKRVYLKLFPLIDSDCLWRIEHSNVAPRYFNMLVGAVHGTRIHGELAIADLGDLGVPEMVPEFADLIMRLRGIRWAFCFGMYRGDLYLSLRTSRRDSDAGAVIQRIVGAHGRAGGHGMIAGGKIPGSSFQQCGRHHQEEQLRRKVLELLDNPDSTGMALLELEREIPDAL